MEKDFACAILEDKYTFKFKEKQKVAVESILHGPVDIIYKHLLSSSYFTRHSCLMAMS
jgi:hypothetical protein